MWYFVTSAGNTTVFCFYTLQESLKRLFSEFGVVKGVWVPSNSSSSERSAYVVC